MNDDSRATSVGQAARQPLNGEFDVAIVGAGFAGMYMLHKARALNLSAIVFERAPDVGGVWYWNTYPGARCDGESLVYSYSFDEELQRDWHWPERFSPQPVLLDYARHVAQRFELRPDIRFNTEVTSARWQGASRRWTVETAQGDTVSARYFIAAVGNLSAVQSPTIAGLETFEGEIYHTGSWPQDPVAFEGKQVVVIGTGSSGVQAIPLIAGQCDRLHVLQRTANYSVPARNTEMRPEVEREFKSNLKEYHELAMKAGLGYIKLNPNPGAALTAQERRHEFQKRWDAGGPLFAVTFPDMMTDRALNDEGAEFLRERIREIVQNPAVADLLSPKDIPVGAKRICVDTGYYETFNLPHVSLVDVKTDPVSTIEADGIRLASGRFINADMIVFATGFDAMTGSILRLNVHGSDGHALKDKWAHGPRTFLGLATASFPNFFFITGPGSPSVLGNVLMHIEQHVEWLSELIRYSDDRGGAIVDVDVKAEDDWVDHVNELASKTLFPQANSWYLGSNIPGKTQIFMPYAGGLPAFVRTCEEVRKGGYAGFSFSDAKSRSEMQPLANLQDLPAD